MLFGSILGALVLVAPAQPNLLTSPCEFGEVYQYTSARCTVEFSNTSDSVVKILNAAPFLARDKITPTSATIPAKGVAYFDVEAAVAHDLGYSEHWFYVTTDDTARPTRNTKASGFVLSVLDDPLQTLDFGAVQAGEIHRKTMSLTSHDSADFRVNASSNTNDYANVQVANDGKTVTVTLAKNAPWGLFDDYLVLGTNSRRQPHVGVRVKADVHGEIVPAENPFHLGLMRKGGNNEALIRLNSRDGLDFKVGKVTIERLQAKAEVTPCRPAAKGCQLLQLVVDDSQPTGMLFGTVYVDLPAYGRSLPIVVNGTLLNQETKIRDLDETREKGAAAAGKSGSLEHVDIGAALHSLAQSQAVAAPAGRGPLLKWNVDHEELIYGYFIFRGDSEAGPFSRVNDATILPKREDGGSFYQWRDISAVPGKTYWYYIGLVQTDGSKKNLSEPQKVVAK